MAEAAADTSEPIVPASDSSGRVAGLFADKLALATAGMIALKVAYSGLWFALGILLTRSLGASGYGAYTYAMSWAVTLNVLATCGLDRLVLRQVAAHQVHGQWGRLRGLLREANRAGLCISLGLALAAALLAYLLPTFDNQEMRWTILVGLVLVPLIVLMRIRQAALQGLHRVLAGQAPDLVLQPLALLTLVTITALVFHERLTAPLAMGLTVVCNAAALIAGAYALNRFLPAEVHTSKPVHGPLPWASSLLPLLVASGVQIVFSQTDILALGAMNGAKAVGTYSVAMRGALLLEFVLQSVTPVLAPRVASLHALGQTRELQRMMVNGVRASVILILPLAIGLILCGNFYLAIFGPDFLHGRAALTTLCCGVLVNLALGPTNWLLILTGHERDVAIVTTCSAIVKCALIVGLIHLWGLEGAAIATAVSLVLSNVLMSLFVYVRLGIAVNVFAMGWYWPGWQRESRESVRGSVS
jgi:O-antigen/teichoic acid export membrane protein